MTQDLPTSDVTFARRRFDETCARLRPDLHRFCTRMTGSPCDGEDVLQEALVTAFYRLPELRDGTAFRPWLFRIAYTRCIDLLRVRRPVASVDGLAAEVVETDAPPLDEVLDDKEQAQRLLGHIVTDLPPRERATVLLKDVLDASLEEIAEVTGSNVGAVKAALHRGREKLKTAHRGPGRRLPMPPAHRALVQRYLAAFNQRDWDGVRALLADEARLDVVHQSEGPFVDACYFVRHDALVVPWRLALAWVDGLETIVRFRHEDGAWRPRSVVQVVAENGEVTQVRDFLHVDGLLDPCVVEE